MNNIYSNFMKYFTLPYFFTIERAEKMIALISKTFHVGYIEFFI